tara:strand:- start:3616 stop:3984 length:369 start_codon:yes stop_codon:yes gene_type:complete
MATLSQQLVLTSTTTSTDALSISTTDSLSVTEPSINVARKSIATGGSTAVLAAVAGKITYLYIKVISGVTATDTVEIDLGGAGIMRMGIGECCFLPLKDGKAVAAQAFGNACVIEYGQWAKS